MAENEYQEEGATEIDFVMRNYKYANMAADMGQCRFGFATDLKAVCAKGDSGATVYKFLKDASGSSNTARKRILIADANGAASSHASLTFDGTTLKIAGALRKAGESVNNLTLGAAGLVSLKSKLMVGSLTETPTVNLAVYADDDSACLLSVGNAFSGPNAGLVIGVDKVVGTNGVTTDSQCVIRADGYGRSIYVQGETATPNVFDTYIACEKLSAYSDYKTVTIADKLVVDGELQIDSNLYVGGLTASQIVETDASKILISVAKGTAYNANFGTGSSDVCRGNDSRLSDARTPINNDYYVQGSSSTRTTDASGTDVNSYSQSGFYGAASTALHLPSATGYGIIHTNHHTTNSRAFQLASRWNANNLYYRTKSDGTWTPWVELYHTGNLNPVDVDYSSISTVVGFSGAPAVNIKYREILGGLIVVRFSISGTSNSTRFYFSLPFTSLQVVASGVCSFASDNSSYVPTPVKISVSLDGYVCLDKGDWSSSSGDGWTASKGKSASGTIVFLRS